MIPKNRAVIGRDLDDIKRQFGLSTANACFLFGLSITKWTEVVNKAADKPVSDPTLALLVRLLDEHPWLNIIPKMPECQEMYDLIKESVANLDQKRFSILMGSEATAAYRWLKVGAKQPSVMARLMLFLKMAIMRQPPESRSELMSNWAATVETEGAARGVPNIFKVGRWTPPQQKAANDDTISDAPKRTSRARRASQAAPETSATKKTPTKAAKGTAAAKPAAKKKPIK